MIEEEEEEDSLFDQRELLIHNQQAHEKVQWKQKVFKTVALSMAFFCVGLCIAIPGPTLLELGHRVHRDTEHMTFIFTARSVGFLIGSLVGGILFDFFDQQILLFYTLSIVAVATAGVPWCTALLSLSALICIQGVAIGVLDTGGNVFCIKIWGKRSAPFMQILHFSFGIGAFLAPLIARPFLLDGDIFHNSSVGSYSPVKLKVNSLGGDRLIRDVSGLSYLNKDGQFDKFRSDYSGKIRSDYSGKIRSDYSGKIHSDYSGKIMNYDTGQDVAQRRVSGFSGYWHRGYLHTNTSSFNKKLNATFEYGSLPGFINVRMKRQSSDNQTLNGQSTKVDNETQVLGSSTEASVKTNVMPSQPEVRARKPGFSNGEVLSKEHADAAPVDTLISNLKKNAPQNSPDTEAITTTGATTKGDGQNVTSGVMINGSYVLNGTDDVSFSWTSTVSATEDIAGLELASSTLPTAAADEVGDSVTAAAVTAVAAGASAADTSVVISTASSATKTPGTTSTSTNIPSTTLAVTHPTMATTTTIPTTTTLAVTHPTTATTTTIPTTASTTAAPSASTRTTVAAPSASTRTTVAAPSASTRTTVVADSAETSSSVTATTTTNKSTAMKPETTGDLFKDVVSTLTGMSKIQFAYTVIGLLLAITAGVFLFLHCKDRSLKSKLLKRQNPDLTRNPFSRRFVASVILLLFLFFLAYMGMEVTFGGLLMTFAVEYSLSPLTPSEGATLTALFWGCLAFGRGCSIFIARCLKPSRMILMNLGLTMFGALILSFSIPVNPAALWVGTVTLGLGMSSLFPTAISWANSCYPLSGSATAVLVAGCAVGEMVVPVITGYLYQVKNKMSVMYMMLFLSCLLAALYFTIQVVVYQKVKSGQRRSLSGFVRLKNTEDLAEDGDLGIAEGMNLGVTETIWRRRLQGEEERGQDTSEGSKFTEFTKLIEM